MIWDFQSLLRILQDFLLAYVSRREQIRELEEYAESSPNLISVHAPHRPKNSVVILQKLDEERYTQVRVYGQKSQNLTEYTGVSRYIWLLKILYQNIRQT